MPFAIQLPAVAGTRSPRHVDIIDGASTAVQREIRLHGLSGYEPPTVSALLALFEAGGKGLRFFDVGANVGLYALLCASCFTPDAVVAFEPTPTTAAMARRIMHANNLDVVVEELALGDRPGTAELYLSAKSDASNSLVEGFKVNTGTVSVVVDTLDAYVERARLVPTVIKIDTETFEPQVLAGARGTLTQHRPHLVVEVLNRRGHDHGVELTEAMDGLGYSYYPLQRGVALEPVEAIRGTSTSPDHDWLLAPEPLPADFAVRVSRWADAVAGCTEATNGRFTLLQTVAAVYSNRGMKGVARGVRNRAREVLFR